MPADPIAITDPDDPRIAVFTALQERDRIGRDGVFIAEGATVLTVLLDSTLVTDAILIEEGRVPRLPVLDARGDAPLYVAPQAVLDRIAGYHLHRGILAAGRIPPPVTVADLPAGPLRLPVLVGLSNHDNVGGIYRNAAAFGAAAVAIDATTANPFYRKAIRVGVGAPLIVPTLRTDDVPAPARAISTPPASRPTRSPPPPRRHSTRPRSPRARPSSWAPRGRGFPMR